MRVDGTKAQPHSLHLSAGQVGELAALLARAANGAYEGNRGRQVLPEGGEQVPQKKASLMVTDSDIGPMPLSKDDIPSSSLRTPNKVRGSAVGARR
jgi:hypothetical protein